jgi:Exostosin family
LLPDPNTDGTWFNGAYDRQTLELLNSSSSGGPATAAPVSVQHGRRPGTVYYRAGNRGFCRDLRRSLQQDYESCSHSFRNWHRNVTRSYRYGMRISTFCPAPVGDSPSAKRMYDCLHAGSIPVILSNDFVWPFTSDVDRTPPHDAPTIGDGPLLSSSISSDTFSIRCDTGEFVRPAHYPATCQLLDASLTSLEGRLDSVAAEQVQKLQQAGIRMSDLCS